jgi:hypothetical protein
MTLDLQTAVASMFTAHVNTSFRFHHELLTAGLELVQVSDESAAVRVNFSLLFRGPQQPLLPQQIYAVDHDALGSFELFIVPIRRDAQGVHYEAVFNR